MAKNTFDQLEQYRRKVAALEQKLSQQKKRLAQLPGKLGFKSVSDLISALQSISEAPKAVKAAGKVKKTRTRSLILCSPQISPCRVSSWMPTRSCRVAMCRL
jgi:hypothetical protein